jgi:tetratricopeptide (TPR) repeat protein
LAVRPEAGSVYNNLGNALSSKGQLDDAIREFRTAIDLNPQFAAPHYNLGNAWRDKKKLDDAIREFRTAIDLNPRFALPHFNLGNIWKDKGKLDEAIREYRTATELDPKYAPAHVSLGLALGRDKDRLDEAVRQMRTALDLDPQNAETHCNLGFLLGRQGKLQGAVAALRAGHKLGSAQPDWRHPSGEWVKKAERLVELDGKLPALLEGTEQPANDAERLELADLCQRRKGLYAAAVKYYAEAFANSAKLANDLSRQHRYSAACAAALAGCGLGDDADKSDEKERVRLRRHALEWLRADLTVYAKHAGSADPKVRDAMLKSLKHWQTDSDLARIRDNDSLNKLPEAERDGFRKLWDDVAALLTKVQAKAK